MEAQAALYLHPSSHQATLLHEYRACLGGEDELFSHGVEPHANFCIWTFPQSQTQHTSVAKSEVPEPMPVLQTVQTLPMHLVPWRSDATSVLTQ